MAHSNNSVITGKLKGMLGKEIVFRDWAGVIRSGAWLSQHRAGMNRVSILNNLF